MKKQLITLFLLGCSLGINAQTWKNLQFNSYQYGLEQNPLKGYATMWDVHTNNPSAPEYVPYSIQGKLFEFDDILTGYDATTNDYIYNWDVVNNFLQTQATIGKHAYLQVNIDPVKKDKAFYLPQFIKDALAVPDPITGVSNIQYPGDTAVVINWNHPAVLNAMLDFVEKFGLEYNEDDRVFIIAMGLYGMWGEWHIGHYETMFPSFEMTEANRNLLADKFATSFPNKQILGRYPHSFANPTRFGYSDGLFFEQSIGQPHWYFQNILNNNGCANAWQQHPIGGEVSPDIQGSLFSMYPNVPNVTGDSVFVADKNKFYKVQRVDSTLKKLHSTWLFMHRLFGNPAETGLTEVDRSNAIRNAQFMGYNFFAKNYRVTATGGFPKLELNIQNKGVAPMYANWDVELAVLDVNGNLTSLKKQKWDLNLLLPSSLTTTKSITSTTSLPNGNYTVLVRIINPLEQYSDKAPPVRFANHTQDMHKKGWLSISTITINNGLVTQSLDAIVQSSYGGENKSIPGNIEGEEYDNGGMNVAYLDNANRSGNVNTIYRPYDKVDIYRKNQASNNFTVGSSLINEWLEYTVDVKESRNYKITLNYFCATNNIGALRVTLDGTEIAIINGIQNLSNWETRGSVTLEGIFIPQGQNKILRLQFVNGAGFDIDNVQFEAQPFITNGTYALKSVSGAYLNATGLTNPLNSTTSLAGNASKWKVTDLGNDIYRFESIQFNNHRMEIPSGNCNSGLSVATTWYTGGENHLKWKASMVNGKLMFEPLHCLGNALDAEISNPNLVKIDTKDASNLDQLFELIPQSSNLMVLSTEQQIEEEKEQVQVYPNPVSDYLTIYIPQAESVPTTVELFDAQGRTISITNNVEMTTKLDLTNVSDDLIFVRIINIEGTEVFKVIHNK